jgi:GNAT superfamily N-acetyltransferase
MQFLLLFEGEEERLIGGIIYKTQGEFVVNLEGLVVAPAFRNLGLGGALLEDFCGRLVSESYKAVMTYYTNRNFFEKNGFRIDSRWGGLVRFLSRTKNMFNFE